MTVRARAIEGGSRWLFAVPLVMLATHLVTYAIYGFDLPCLDDWGPYLSEHAGSYRLADLFIIGNDTIYPVGRFLDAAAQNLLRGNSIAYQLISMVVLLGALLFAQWRMLDGLVGDRVTALCLFGLCAFSLQAKTYWGLQNNAYIQGVPIVCILLTLYLIVASRWPDPWRLVAILLLSAISGLSYISGALALLPLGLVILVFASGAEAGARRFLTRAALAVLAAGAVTACVQVGFVVRQQGTGLHRADAKWAFPTELDFWAYLLGKIGKSLSLPLSLPLLTLALTLALAAAVSALVLHALLRSRTGASAGRFYAGLILCALGSVSLLNIAMAAAGRAKLRPDHVDTALKVFFLGFENRFHFFWPTLVWPWVVAYLVLTVGGDVRRTRRIAASAALILLTLGVGGGLFRITRDYLSIAVLRQQELACLQVQANVGRRIATSSDQVDCPPFIWADMTRAFVYARRIKASFTRSVPVTPLPIGVEPDGLAFRMTSAEDQIRAENADPAERSPDGWEFRSTDRPRLRFEVDARKLERCLLLQVSARIRVERDDVWRLSFGETASGQTSEQEAQPVPVVARAGGIADVHFFPDTLDAFTGAFRLEAVSGGRSFALQELEARCRLFDPTGT